MDILNHMCHLPQAIYLICLTPKTLGVHLTAETRAIRCGTVAGGCSSHLNLSKSDRFITILFGDTESVYNFTE